MAQGYKQADLVGGALFPQVPVGLRAGKIVTFGKEDFMLYNTRRAPGENTKRVQFGFEGKPFALKNEALEGHRGAKMWAVNVETGEQSAGLELTSPPVWDGIAVSQGRVFVSTMDGKLQCFGK